jgi:transglutaminase-like putative cysteine protease
MRNPAAISARAALAALSLVAAFSLARCFVGPGEVLPAAVAAIVGDVSILLATSAARRSRSLGASLAVIGPVAVVIVPLWIVLGGATTWGWPTFSTWSVVAGDLSHAWSVFNILRAPVPELPGFSLVGAWAVGGAALLAGWAADGGDTPLWVVAPPSAIFLFTSALGTAGWRPLAITAEVAALGWYAASARAARRVHTIGIAERQDAAGGRRPRLSLGMVWPAAAIVTIAALLAGLVGPRLPGAVSPALVSLRNNSGGSYLGSGGDAISAPVGQINVSTLVQVAQEEIYQPKALFFIIATPAQTYTILTTLDGFNGDVWSSTEDGAPFGSELPYLGATVPGVEHVGDYAYFESQVEIDQLGGNFVPTPALPVEGQGPGTLTYDGPHATLLSALELDDNAVFDIVSRVAAGDPDKAPPLVGPLPPTVQPDVDLPAGVPSSIVQLAHQLVAGATTEYQKALDIQDFFLTGKFTYNLPKAVSGSGETVSGGEGLQDLEKFLFGTRTGFCQQFASAFAVLARIDGLPTRIAVGFTPGTEISQDAYQVTGTDVHAWPQVYLGGDFGWWSFEPTPGAVLPPNPFTTGSSKAGGGSNGTRPKGSSTSKKPAGGTRGGSTTTTTLPGGGQSGGSGSSGAATVWAVLGGLLVLLLGAAPAARFARRRRAASGAARVANAWSEVMSALALLGLYQHDGETFAELARRVGKSGALPQPATDSLERLARHTTVAAYAPNAPPPDAVRDAVEASREVCTAARRAVSTWRRGWASVDPRRAVRSR